MKVCIITPDRPYLIDQKALPSLGPLYVAKALKESGHEAEVLDFADRWDFVEADVYGIYIITPDFDRACEILNWLKAKGARKVVAGGPHVNVSPHECLDAGFDGVSVGDGELTIERLASGERLVSRWSKKIDGFYPDRTAIDLWDYEFYVSDVRATPLVTSRGCWWAVKSRGGCAFCSRCDKGMLRYNSVEHVKTELKEIDEFGFEAIAMYDDEFFSYPKRDVKIAHAMSEFGFTWRCFSRADLVIRYKDVVKEAAESGLYEVLLGAESASDQVLTAINKGVTKRQMEEAIDILYNLDVRVKAAFIVGNPSESDATLTETEEFIEKSIDKIAHLDFTILQVYPGCDISEHPEKYDLTFEPSRAFYKGKPGKYSQISPISTSSLSFEDIVAWRNRMGETFNRKVLLR